MTNCVTVSIIILSLALIELDSDGDIISPEEYYSFGGTAVWVVRDAVEAK